MLHFMHVKANRLLVQLLKTILYVRSWLHISYHTSMSRTFASRMRIGIKFCDDCYNWRHIYVLFQI